MRPSLRKSLNVMHLAVRKTQPQQDLCCYLDRSLHIRDVLLGFAVLPDVTLLK
jgi:hypothetical protein